MVLERFPLSGFASMISGIISFFGVEDFWFKFAEVMRFQSDRSYVIDSESSQLWSCDAVDIFKMLDCLCKNRQMRTRNTQPLKAWVVFARQSSAPWFKVFKSDFQHCYVIFNDGQHWLHFDPLSGYKDVKAHELPVDFDLPFWLKDRGLHVVRVPVLPQTKEKVACIGLR